jgi:hypothetical protein
VTHLITVPRRINWISSKRCDSSKFVNSRAVIYVEAKCFIKQKTRSLEMELSEQHTDSQTVLSKHLETNFNLISKLLQADTFSNDFKWSSKFIISKSEKSIKIQNQTIARNSLNHTVLTNVYLTCLFPHPNFPSPRASALWHHTFHISVAGFYF